MVHSGTWEFHLKHFSDARLKHYLTAGNGDTSTAIDLYRWNSSISSAFWDSLGHVEVAMRNAIDRRMCAMHSAKGRSGHWIFDDDRELGRDAREPGVHKYPYLDAHVAIGRVRRNGMPLDPGQVISELSFGFWHQMVSKSQLFLWPDLVAAFPGTPNRRQTTIHDPIARLRAFRNRIGHHHRIWTLDVPGRYADLLTIAQYVDPALSAWIDGCSRARDVLAERPEITETAPPGRLDA